MINLKKSKTIGSEGVVMEKLKNYGLWVALAALIYLVLEDAGFSIDPTRWETYVSLIMFILVTAGLVSSPDKGKWFKDDEQ